MFTIEYTDIMYRTFTINKIILCGSIVNVRDSKSPRGNDIKIIRLKDETGFAHLQVYQSPLWDELPGLLRSRNSVKLCINVKSMGLGKL